MPRVSLKINAFNGGEVAPEFTGRTDIAKYATGAKRIENFIVHPEGGVHRRTGSRFVKNAIDATKKSRLIPFIFSTTQAYVLELSEFKARVYANNVQIAAPTNTLGVPDDTDTEEFAVTDHGYVDQQGPFQLTTTGTLPAGLSTLTDYYMSMAPVTTFADSDIAAGVITKTAHGYTDNQGPLRLTTTGALPTGIEANVDYFIVFQTANTFMLSASPASAGIVTSTEFGGTHTLSPTGDYLRDKFRLSLTAGGAAVDITSSGSGTHTITPNPLGTPTGLPLEIPTPFTEAELYEVHFVQSADFLFLAHKNHAPLQLTRTGNTKWALDFVNRLDGPFLAENTSTTTVTPSATTGFILLTFNSVLDVNGGAGLRAQDIGRFVRIKVGTGNWGHAEITGIQSNLVARATVRSTLAGTAATTAWRLGSWYTNNWPQAISFFEQRLGYAGEPDTPQTLHGSATGLFNIFSPTELDGTVLDTNAVNFQIGANQVNAIRWLGVGRQLFAGTPGSVFVARASRDSEAVTPTNITMPQVTAIGALPVQPINISDQLVYITRNSQSLRGIQLAADADTFTPVDVTLLAKHIFGRTKTITTMGFQFDRQQVLWLTRSDGVLVAVTYIPEQEVFAWHRHIVGGSFGSGAAVVESVAVIPNSTGTHDQVWISVKRTVNGATVRHIEFFEDEWLDGITKNMRFVDSAPAAYSGVATATFSGLDHLEGQTVQVLAEGAAHPDRVVSGGSITLDASYTDVVAGLKYVSELETLNLEPPDPEGASSGKVARIDHLSMRLHETIGGEVGPDLSHMDPIVFRNASDPMDAPPPVFSGDKEIPFPEGFNRKKSLIFRQNQPLPFNLLSVNVRMSTGAR